MVEGGMKCVKYLLFAFNFIFFLAGIALIVAGALVETKFREEYDFFDGKFNAVAIFIIVVGVIIFLIAFFGCCGAWKENYCMTMTFAVLLGLVFILEIAGGITAFVFRNQIEKLATENMQKTMINYKFAAGTSSKVTKTWDLAQHTWKCCGANSSADWQIFANNTPPTSCCIDKSDNCSTKTSTEIYNNGCVSSFVDWAKGKIIIIGGVGIAVALIQIIGIILACCLARTIKKEYEVV